MEEDVGEEDLPSFIVRCRQKQLEGVRTRMDDINTAVDEGRWRDSVRNNIESELIDTTTSLQQAHILNFLYMS